MTKKEVVVTGRNLRVNRRTVKTAKRKRSAKRKK